MNANTLFMLVGVLVASLLASCGSHRLHIYETLQHVDPRTLEVHPDRFWSTDGSLYLTVVKEMDSCRARYAVLRTADDSVLSYIDYILLDRVEFSVIGGLIFFKEFRPACWDLPSGSEEDVSLIVNSATGKVIDRSSDSKWYIGSDDAYHYFRSQGFSSGTVKRAPERLWDTLFAYDRFTYARSIRWVSIPSDTSAPIAIHEKFVVIGKGIRDYSTPPYMYNEAFGIDFEYVESTNRDTLYLGRDERKCEIIDVGRGYLLKLSPEIVNWVVEGYSVVFEVHKLLFDKGELYPERFGVSLKESEESDVVDYYRTLEIRSHDDDRIIVSVARRFALHMHGNATFPVALFEINLVDRSVRFLRMIEE